MHLSDVFKFTQGLGQKGHQIGRKVGDAIELITLAMVYRQSNLAKYLEIEDGIEGATTAKHKVEFSFYNLEDEKPSKKSEDLFAIIECKKVGVEQTVKQNFKTWKSKTENKTDFHKTNGYSFRISPSTTNFRWSIDVKSLNEKGNRNNIKISVDKIENRETTESNSFNYNCSSGDQLLIGHDINNKLFVLGPDESLVKVDSPIKKCVIIQVKSVSSDKIKTIHVNESLPGPQTPEKAKQASFVSLDVRKKVLGRFDKTESKDFISILVIGEASHWEEKSRSIVRLCNDYNLIIPDAVLVKLFKEFESKFGERYQEKITKTSYKDDQDVRSIVDTVINYFDSKVLFEMGTQNYMEFEYYSEDGKNKVKLKSIQ